MIQKLKSLFRILVFFTERSVTEHSTINNIVLNDSIEIQSEKLVAEYLIIKIKVG